MEFLSIYQLLLQLTFICLLFSVSLLIPLDIAPALKMGHSEVHSWFIIGQRDWGWKKLHTELNSVANWNSQEQNLLSD